MRPTPKHAPVERYVTPERFDDYAREGREMGFAFIASGPLVRSSYHAAEGFVEARLRPPEREPRGRAVRRRLARRGRFFRCRSGRFRSARR